MLPDPLTPVPIPPTTPGDIDARGAVGVLPPHYQSMLDGAAVELSVAEQESYGLISAKIDETKTEMVAATIEQNSAIAALVGQVDADLRAAVSPVYRALDKVYDATLRALIFAEEDMRVVGVAIPHTIAQREADMSDPSGEPIFARLTGVAAAAPVWMEPRLPVVDDLAPVPIPPVPGEMPELIPPEEPPAVRVPEEPAADPHCGCPPPVINVVCGPGMAPVALPGAPVGIVPIGLPMPVPGPAPGVPVPVAPVAPVPGPVPPVPPPPADPIRDIIGAITRPGGDPVDSLLTWAMTIPADPPILPGRFDTHQICGALLDGWGLYGVGKRGGGFSSFMTTGSISQSLRGATTLLLGLTDVVFGGADPKRQGPALDASYRLMGDWIGGYSQAVAAFGNLDPGALPDRDRQWNLAITIGAAHKSEASSSIPLGYLSTSQEYLFRAISPQYIPEQAELDAMRVGGYIDKAQWECMTKMHGAIPLHREALIDLRRPKPGIAELVALKLRGAIDPDQYREFMKEHGVGARGEEALYTSLAQWIPQPPDLVRFMVRDVFDPTAVRDGALDTDFEAKFYGPGGRAEPGPAAKWAKAHGLTEDTFRLFWRAHWEWPSPTQIYEMLHRLRPDRPEVEQFRALYQLWLDNGEQGPAPVSPPILTEEMAREILQINDIAPAMIDSLMAVSYNPMTRTDAINAYMANTMNAEELRERFRDTGSDLATATRMVEIQKNLKARRMANVSGVWTVRKIAGAYRDGTLTGVQADQLLIPLIPDAQQRALVIDGIDTEATAMVRARSIARIKREHLTGAIDNNGALKALVGVGVDPLRRTQLVDMWDHDRRGRLKEPTAKQIIAWAKQSLILPDDAFDRLRRIGYGELDAKRIVYEGLIARSDLIQGKVEKEQKRVEKVIKDMKAARKEEKKDLEARQKEIEKQQKKLKAEQERIQKELDDRMP